MNLLKADPSGPGRNSSECKIDGLGCDAFDIECVSKGLRVAVVSQLASITLGATWVLNRERFRTAKSGFWVATDSFGKHVTKESADTSRGAVWTVALFFTIHSNRDNGDSCCKSLDDLRHTYGFPHNLHCFYAMQETDNWTTSVTNAPGCVVRQISHFRLSWV